MASLQFGSWVWEWHKLQAPDIKASLEEEIIGGGWLFRQSAKDQVQILDGAPEDFIKRILADLKPEVAIELGFNPFLREWRRR